MLHIRLCNTLVNLVIILGDIFPSILCKWYFTVDKNFNVAVSIGDLPISLYCLESFVYIIIYSTLIFEHSLYTCWVITAEIAENKPNKFLDFQWRRKVLNRGSHCLR